MSSEDIEVPMGNHSAASISLAHHVRDLAPCAAIEALDTAETSHRTRAAGTRGNGTITDPTTEYIQCTIVDGCRTPCTCLYHVRCLAPFTAVELLHTAQRCFRNEGAATQVANRVPALALGNLFASGPMHMDQPWLPCHLVFVTRSASVATRWPRWPVCFQIRPGARIGSSAEYIQGIVIHRCRTARARTPHTCTASPGLPVEDLHTAQITIRTVPARTTEHIQRAVKHSRCTPKPFALHRWARTPCPPVEALDTAKMLAGRIVEACTVAASFRATGFGPAKDIQLTLINSRSAVASRGRHAGYEERLLLSVETLRASSPLRALSTHDEDLPRFER